MSSPSDGLSSGTNSTWSLAFWNRVHRYRCLVAKYWWVIVATTCIALFIAALYQTNRPPQYSSSGKISINVEVKSITANTDQSNNMINQDLDNFMAEQIDIIKNSSQVHQMTVDRLMAKYPDMPASPVALDFQAHVQSLLITATGMNPIYTERYLQATLDSYLAYRKKFRDTRQGEDLDTVQTQALHLEDQLKKDGDALIQFQRDKKVVIGKDDANNDGGLADLKRKRDDLQEEYNKLMLITPEQTMQHDVSTGKPVRRAEDASGNQDRTTNSSDNDTALESSSARTEYRTAQATIVELKAQLEDFSRDMRPKHPKIIALTNAIKVQEKVMANALEYSRKWIEDHRNYDLSMIKMYDAQVKEAEPKALEYNLILAEYNKLLEVKQRDERTYNDLQKTIMDGTLSKTTDRDNVFIMEPASVAVAVISAWFKMIGLALIAGLGSGIAILLLLDRMDDRMGSISDFQMHFAEHVLGQIPRDESGDNAELLRPDDTRHQLVESFRNLRSTLLFMPLDGARPKTLLVTSAVPNEGKSTLSSNLALVLAFAGMKTLLIDADLRRGAIHQSFGVSRDPGLTDVLGHNVNWKLAIRTTGIENLHVLPRGRNVPQPSEYLLNKATDRLLQELYPLYDYIIIDSSPVLAADDTASLAPKIDATLFVVRMGFTSAKMTRKSLEILYKRQANIPGLILNQVDTSSPEFVYYQYQEYYTTATNDEDIPPEKIKRVKKPVSPVSHDV